MKQRRHRRESFSLYDRTHIARHLEKLARQGWMLERIGTAFGWWHYRRIEPKPIRFAVSYRAGADLYDPAPTPEQETFYDLCAHDGWTLAASYRELQIFYSERPDPVPLETDPVVEVENIRRVALRGILPGVIAGLFLLGLAVLCFLLCSPEEFLETPELFLLFPASILFLALFLSELLVYLRWLRRADRAAQEGTFLETPNSQRFHRVSSVLICGMLALLLLYLAGMPPKTMVNSLIIPVSILFASLLRTFWKRKGVPAAESKGWMLSAVFLTVLVGTVLVDAWTWPAYWPWENPPLLSETVLLEGEVLQDGSYSRSPFWNILRCWQFQPWEDGEDVYYTLVEVKVPFLKDYCRRALEEGRTLEPQDAAPWGAQAAARLSERCYLLDYGDYLLRITCPAPPDPEDMARIGAEMNAFGA